MYPIRFHLFKVLNRLRDAVIKGKIIEKNKKINYHKREEVL